MYKSIRMIALASVVSLAQAAVARGAEDFGYIDSHGRQVSLQLAADRLVVIPGPALRARPQVPGLAAEQPRLRAAGLWQYRLTDEFRGRQLEVAEQLVARGLALRAGLVFAVPGRPELTFTLDRQVLVHLQRGTPANLVAELSGLEVVEPLDALGTVWLFRATDARQALRLASRAARMAGVNWALPDFGVPVTLYRQSNDTYYANQWHLYQASDADIDADEAWDVTMGDSQVIVAVVDTGVETTHPDFDPSHLVTGYNAVTDTNDPTPLSLSIDAHGTCCSGAIAAWADNGQGVAGICPNCSLMPIKMMDGQADDTQLSNGYRALTYATEHGAWVISNSWGIDEQYIGQIDIAPYYAAVRDAVNNGRGGAGAVVLFASGNGNQWTGQGEPIGEHELQNMPEVMAVGGSGYDDTVVTYSDYGPNLSVVAPTGAIDMSNTQNPFSAPQIVTTDTTGDQGFSRGGYYYMFNPWGGGDQKTDFPEIDSSGDYTQMFNGTSAACPIAAGVVALVLSANPSLSGAQARLIIEATADKIGGVSYDAEGHNDNYGHGRVNAGRAVKAAVLGLGNPDGAACVDDINCQSGACHLPAGAGQGNCITPCSTSSDCPDGGSCQDLGDGTRACVYTCSDDSECSLPALCLPDGGESRCQALECHDGSECPSGTSCPFAGGFCSRPCSGDGDCQPPDMCLAGSSGDVCQTIACDGEGDCPAGTACPPGGGTCTRTCTSDRDCVTPQLCLPAAGGDLCQAVSCSGDGDCPGGTACPPGGGTCRRTCGSDNDCAWPELCLPAGGGELCQAIACNGSGDCPDGTACPPSGGNCLRTCSSDDECTPPALCLDSGGGPLCLEVACQQDADCPPGTECGPDDICQKPSGGGCSCSTSGHRYGGLLLLLLGLLLAGRRHQGARR